MEEKSKHQQHSIYLIRHAESIVNTAPKGDFSFCLDDSILDGGLTEHGIS
jgi:broad specificity phosphatase PhoE